MHTFDVIVIGTGGAGSGAVFQLANRGVRVLGLDQFPGGHDRGSSHGQTRIIRQAYFEHPDYVPLLLRAYELWSELEALCGEKLYYETGLIEIGPPDGVVIPGVLESASQHGLDVEQLSRDEASRRYSQFVVPEGCDAVFERRAGYVLVENCVLAHLRQARELGAELKTETVRGWNASGSSVVVQTNRGEYSAGRLIITAGAWASDLLSSLGVKLRVVLKHLHWYANHDSRYKQEEGCPTFFCEVPNGYYYGFPQLDSVGVKVAEHSGGETVTDPLNPNSNVDVAERKRVERFLAEFLPGVSDTPTKHSTCFYTLSTDEHFIVDRHPEHEQVAFAAGLSGHGFKFTTVLGEILAELTLGGQTTHPIDFLNCRRPQLQN